MRPTKSKLSMITDAMGLLAKEITQSKAAMTNRLASVEGKMHANQLEAKKALDAKTNEVAKCMLDVKRMQSNIDRTKASMTANIQEVTKKLETLKVTKPAIKQGSNGMESIKRNLKRLKISIACSNARLSAGIDVMYERFTAMMKKTGAILDQLNFLKELYEGTDDMCIKAEYSSFFSHPDRKDCTYENVQAQFQVQLKELKKFKSGSIELYMQSTAEVDESLGLMT